MPSELLRFLTKAKISTFSLKKYIQKYNLYNLFLE